MNGSGITVVIPFYNRSEFSDRLFRSILAQTVRPEAVYVVDNGSSSEHVAECRRIAAALDWRDVGLFFLRTETSGNANFARNLGMKEARTRYVAFLDSDDWWDPCHLEVSLDRLRQSQRAGIYGGAIVHRKGIWINRSRDVDNCASPFELLFSEDLAQTSSYVVDKQVLGPTVRWDESLKRHQDFDFFLQVFYESSGWAFVESPSTHVDWDRGGAKGRTDFRSMIRFQRKWARRIPLASLEWYAYSQVLRCRHAGAPRRYARYYKRLYLNAAGDDLRSRLRCLEGYLALKDLVHRLKNHAA